MNTSLTRRRSRLARRFGWLVVAGLTTAALIGPSASAALANDLHQSPPIAWNNPDFQGSENDCADAGLEPGEVLWHFLQNQTDASSGNLTATFAVAGVVGPIANDDSPSANLHWFIITGEDTLLDASSDVESKGHLNLSHICGGGATTTSSSSSSTTSDSSTTTSDSSSSTSSSSTSSTSSSSTSSTTSSTTSETTSTTTSETTSTTTTEPTPTPTPTPTPNPTPTPTPQREPTPTPTPTPNPTPTPTPTPVPTPTPTPSPTGEVLSETGAPAVTLPPTDTFSGNSSAPAGDSWRLILLAMAGILAGTLVLTPNQSVVKRDDR